MRYYYFLQKLLTAMVSTMFRIRLNLQEDGYVFLLCKAVRKVLCHIMYNQQIMQICLYVSFC